MRIFQSIFIFSILFFASNQCNAGILDFPAIEVYDHTPCEEKTDLDDVDGVVNLIHFFQRTKQVNVYYPCGKDLPGELFLKFGKMKDTSEKLDPSFLFCTPIGITLIFPKHYFF